ncbi:MAG TPA: sensor histidine kinase KdpD [Candidatus Eisenbacteria bacterium]|nr:sensor histidine kinase KdpD [Candidatus Eisenbacteria bacterium]
MCPERSDRPDPDHLLRRLQEKDQLEKRAKLKIFFGASPGVGKTYAMLVEAQEMKRAGFDVVAGVVETHGRGETGALLAGIERIPPQELSYRGVTLREFDLDAALARKPDLLLVDELAHTNAPGSRHRKRWQDVEELLEAGISVATTLNVQHVDSLNDVVESFTGVRVRETVPDSILDRADEIELIDLPPDDLLQRLREGKVYVPEQAGRAIENFFQKGNLIALRELALRRTAERVDAQMESWRRIEGVEEIWPVGGRLLACIGDPESGLGLVRGARRIASALKAEWLVMHVETPAALRRGRGLHDRVVDVMGLAEDLGAETAIVSGQNVVDEILAYAREHHVARILVGPPRGPRWMERILGSVATDLVLRADEFDVHVHRGKPEDEDRPLPLAVAPRSGVRGYLQALVAVALCTAISLFLDRWFEPANIAMAYLVCAALVAVAVGRGPSILASVLGVLVFDYLFVPPYHTIAVADSQYLITMGVTLVVALLLSTMATRLREQAQFARRREERNAALYRLSRELAASADPGDLLAAAARSVESVFDAPVAILLPDADGRVVPRTGALVPLAADPHERGVAQWTFDHEEAAGHGTDTLPAAKALYLPLVGSQKAVGVLGIRPVHARDVFRPDQLRLLRTFANQTAIALERSRLVEQAEAARVDAEAERTRSSLLSSVSHDLRTPLAAITGAATSLQDGALAMDGGTRRELLATIVEESNRLTSLVQDLLEMTRLESGVRAQKEWHSLEEVVGAALARFRAELEGRDVTTRIPADLPLVPLDAVLFTQALVHLLENALRYTPSGSPIQIDARREDKSVVIEVADRGPGLTPGDEERIFEKFYRGKPGAVAAGRPGGAAGVGLGLAICRAIVVAHGGSIRAANRPGGGTVFEITLPLEAEPPVVPPEEPEAASSSVSTAPSSGSGFPPEGR